MLDTGAIYRAVALEARAQGVDWGDAERLADLARTLDIDFAFDGLTNLVRVAGHDVSTHIRSPEISQGASRVSAHAAVRDALLELQRRLGAQGGVVAEGRDIGTVVFPSAGAKFYLTASAEERARRRVAELRASGREVDEASTLAEILERDHRDQTRAAAPLKQAADAVLVDSSGTSLEEVVAFMEREVRQRAG
jgi:cytidylate kinase